MLANNAKFYEEKQSIVSLFFDIFAFNMLEYTSTGGDIMLSLVREFTAIYKDYYQSDRQLTNPNIDICRQCEGKCCKQCGCYFSPYDFNNLSFGGLKSVMDLGYISIDTIIKRHSGLNNDYLILRIRNKERNIYDAYHISGKLGCALLTSTGCTLNYEERPRGGRMLIPKRYNLCEPRYTLRECSLEWRHYQSVLNYLAEHYIKEEEHHCYENQLIKKRISRAN